MISKYTRLIKIKLWLDCILLCGFTYFLHNSVDTKQDSYISYINTIQQQMQLGNDEDGMEQYSYHTLIQYNTTNAIW
jgi:hypothetical protein